MRRLLVLGCAVSLSAMSLAHAQTPADKVPEDLKRAAQAVLDYAKAVPDPHMVISTDIKSYLNSPLSQIETWIARDRAELAKGRQDLAALKLPVSKVKGFDLTFALVDLREDAEANLARVSEGLDAIEAMIRTRRGPDCAAYKTHADLFDKAARDVRLHSTWQAIDTLQTLLARHAGGEPPQPLLQVAPPAMTHGSRMKLLANELAAALRCPLPAESFEIEVTAPSLAAAIHSFDKVYADTRVISGLEGDRRAAIEMRMSNFEVPNPARFSKWEEARQPLKFKWDGQVLAPVLE